jgi:hypothetical protein
MIIEPRVRGFICTTAHPVGCATNVREQIAYVLSQGAIPDSPKRVAVLGCSTGYGLASRIVATFAGGADTIGVSLEREPTATRTGSAGWYNNRAFEIEAKKIGRSPLTLEGDAFSDEMKKNFIDAVREKFGQLDLLVYSMAAPVRTDPDTGKTWRSAIKPLGEPVETDGDQFAGAIGQRLRAFIHLDAGNGTGLLDQADQRCAVFGVLPDGLIIEDHARDRVAHGLARAEQHLAVIASALFGGGDADGVKALLDGAR